MNNLSRYPAIKIEDVIEYNSTNTIIFNLSKLEVEGITKIIKSLKLEDDEMGVYIFFKNNINSVENIVYIGKARTVEQNGEFKGQALIGRLTNSRDNQSPRIYFKEKFTDNTEINQIVIMCCTADKQIIPAYLEACLLQDYYNQKKTLPEWNVAL